MNKDSNKNILSGVMLTAGSAIGAGMFSLPIVSSGMWSFLSIFCLGFIWFISYLSAVYILEVNLRFSPGDSFNTLVKSVLGKTWSTVNGLAIAFLLSILLYAFFSAFGSMVTSIIGETNLPSGTFSLLLGGILAAVVWSSTQLVGRISTILVVGMVITFILSMSGFTLHLEFGKLLDSQGEDGNYLPYVWAALPYFITSFGFASIVPSLYKYYGNAAGTIKKTMFIGSLIALIVYTLFIFVVFGNISRTAFIDINEAGGNMGTLVDALTKSGDTSLINKAFTLFSNFAIITSFLGVGLSLLDYVIDLFSFPNTKKARFYAACITFLPSGILSFFFPNGFIAAIGYAGLILILTFFIIPYLMVKKTRKEGKPTTFKVKGGHLLLNVFLFSSILIAVFHVLAKLNYLPTW